MTGQTSCSGLWFQGFHSVDSDSTNPGHTAKQQAMAVEENGEGDSPLDRHQEEQYRKEVGWYLALRSLS